MIDAGVIVINCDCAPACTATFEHTTERGGLDLSASAPALRNGHQAARRAAKDAGWHDGPTGTLLCKDCPDMITGPAGDTTFTPREVLA